MLRTLLCLLSLIVLVYGAEFSPPGGGDLLRVLVRDRSGQVITSSNTTLYTLSNQLTIVGNPVRYDGHLTVLTANSGHLLVCDSSPTCNLTTNNGNTVTISNFLRSDRKVISVSLLPQSNPNIIFVHSRETNFDTNEGTLSIVTVNIASASYFARRDISESVDIRTVVSTITTDQFVYYIINDDTHSDVVLVRVCANDTGVTVITPFATINRVNSVYEVTLQCGGTGELSALSSTYISDVNGGHIIVSFTDMTRHHVLCDYKETNISSLFTNKFDECVVRGMGISGRSVGLTARRPCRGDLMASECAIGEDNDYSLEVDAPHNGDVVLTTSSGVVSLLATNSYGFSYLFAATSNSQTNKYLATITSTTLTLRESFSITVGPVTSLAVSPDQTVLYALIPNKLISFPGERCGDHTSCNQCVDQVDPVCGWCALDNKCSTNDSCSSSLWISSNGVSSSDQCPTGSITNNITVSTEQPPHNICQVQSININKMIRRRRVIIKFLAQLQHPDIRYHCKLDDNQSRRCNNSVTYTNLSVGKHTVRIRARCRGGAWKRKNINFRIRT